MNHNQSFLLLVLTLLFGCDSENQNSHDSFNDPAKYFKYIHIDELNRINTISELTTNQALNTNAFRVEYLNDSITRITFLSHGRQADYLPQYDISRKELAWNFMNWVSEIRISRANGYEKREYYNSSGKFRDNGFGNIERLRMDDGRYQEVFYYDSLLDPISKDNPLKLGSLPISDISSRKFIYMSDDSTWSIIRGIDGKVINESNRSSIEIFSKGNANSSNQNTPAILLKRFYLNGEFELLTSDEMTLKDGGIILTYHKTFDSTNDMPFEMWTKNHYDKNDNLIKVEYLDDNLEPIRVFNDIGSIPVVKKFEYDSWSNLINVKLLGADYLPLREGLAEIQIARNSARQNILESIRGYDKSNNPMSIGKGHGCTVTIKFMEATDSLLVNEKYCQETNGHRDKDRTFISWTAF